MRPDLVADLPERGLDRHAELNADQQQIERVGESALDRQLAALDLVLQQHQRQLHADIGGGDTDADLDHRRLIKLENDEQIYDREQEQRDRRQHAEKQIGHVGRLAAIAGLDELQARFFLAHPFAEVEAIDDGLDIFVSAFAGAWLCPSWFIRSRSR